MCQPNGRILRKRDDADAVIAQEAEGYLEAGPGDGGIVKDDDLRPHGGHARQNVLEGARFPDHFHVGTRIEDAAETFSDDAMIVAEIERHGSRVLR